MAVKVYTDGSFQEFSKQAGLGVYWGEGDTRNLSESCPTEDNPGSLRAEIHAFRRFFEQIGAADGSCTTRWASGQEFIVLSDNLDTVTNLTHLRTTLTEREFRRRGKGKPLMPEGDLLDYVEALLENAERTVCVTIQYVAAHKGNVGNSGAHRLAKAGRIESRPVQQRLDWREMASEVRIWGSVQPTTGRASGKRKRELTEEEDGTEEEEEDEDEDSSNEDDSGRSDSESISSERSESSDSSLNDDSEESESEEEAKPAVVHTRKKKRQKTGNWY